MDLLPSEVVFFHTGPYVVVALSVIVVLLLLLGPPAAYGRYENKLFGPVIPAKWAWIIQESPCLFSIYFFITGDSDHKNIIVHYSYRSLVYPFLLKSRGGFTLVTFFFACCWCVYNGFMQGRWFAHYSPVYSIEYLSSWTFILGSLTWAIGFAINIHSDNILLNLRKPGETGYKIPFGGMFNYVTGANYFGEIVEWTGFAIATGFAAPAVSFAIFTLSNIGPRAIGHHKWYKTTFGDKYPKHRKALIPFVI